jgi:hypothetical protein
MRNEFSLATKELFFWNNECWECKMSHANCLHHILNRVSNSPLNAAPLNNFSCHIGNGKLSTFEIRKKLLNKTLLYLKENGYVLDSKDREFKEKYKNYYE